MRRHFPDLLQAWRDYMKASEAPQAYIDWAFISCVAGALERKVWLQRRSAYWYPNLYLFLIGPAGSGKSTVAETAMSLLREVPGVEFISTRTNEASLFQEMHRIGKTKEFEYGGQSYPHSAGTLFASEASEAFKEMYKGGGVIGLLTDLFNGGKIQGWSNTHGESRSTIGAGRNIIYNPCINLLACSTPEWLLTRCLTKNDAEGGFGSRILLIVSKEQLRANHDWDEADLPHDMMLRKKIVEDLQLVHKLQGPYKVGPCFSNAYRKISLEYEGHLKEVEKAGLYAGYKQRKLTQLNKLAIVLAACRRDELEIKGADLRDAWQMLNKIEPSMLALLEGLDMSASSKLQSRMLMFLEGRDSPQVLKSELVREFKKDDYKMVMQAIDALVVMGYLVPQQQDARRTLYHFLSSTGHTP